MFSDAHKKAGVTYPQGFQAAGVKAGIKKSGLLVMNTNEIGNRFWQSQGWTKREDVTYYSINTSDFEQ